MNRLPGAARWRITGTAAAAAGSFEMIDHRYERNDLSQISNWWQDRMRRAAQELPSEWVDRAFSKLTAQATAL
jgi:hypothetical protein